MTQSFELHVCPGCERQLWRAVLHDMRSKRWYGATVCECGVYSRETDPVPDRREAEKLLNDSQRT